MITHQRHLTYLRGDSSIVGSTSDSIERAAARLSHAASLGRAIDDESRCPTQTFCPRAACVFAVLTAWTRWDEFLGNGGRRNIGAYGGDGFAGRRAGAVLRSDPETAFAPRPAFPISF